MPVFEATDVIEMSLELEKSGEAFYRSVASKAPTAAVASLFTSLADAELEHYAAFEALSQTIWESPPMLPEQWTQYMLYLQSTIQSVFFQGVEALHDDQCTVAPVRQPLGGMYNRTDRIQRAGPAACVREKISSPTDAFQRPTDLW